MKTKFIQVDYDLLSTTQLHSTQKLLIAYIIGWQRNKKICKEANNTLANKFGMKYSGIRTLISDLNKFDFFQSISIDYNKSNSTSGHQITVNETKLKSFLALNKESKTETIEVPNEVVIENIVQIDETEDEITMGQPLMNNKVVQSNIDDLEENYEIEIDEEKDIIRSCSIMEKHYIDFGDSPNYINANIFFAYDNSYMIGKVFKVTGSTGMPQYIDKGTFEMFLKEYKKEAKT